MGFLDEAKQKATEFLNSDKAEEQTDQVLDKAADFAKDKLGEDKADQVDKVRNAIDDKIGGKGQEQQ
ncbi:MULTISPECIES: antitoxin [unclassified Corynebacterium]|uniref:antitoxin n=1 Tax=unclassified Corynebacterium TaxID=2624378 RepID=UPI0029CA20F2|nr:MULTISPECIES: antitoxin [unclassified Corynebacterium]WPF66869.1 antitoxin [Corynebacterium sp. 22KM0430]WPF69357.1 antitoxin [Corynebacterium sp. 21KM1197]